MAQLMQLRWMLSEDGGATFLREVKPFGKFSYSYERDLKAGQIFFRHKLNSKITFKGDDFRFLYLQERQPTRRCKEFFIRREWRCAYTWKVYWTGTFSVGAGDFDLDLCEFTVKPEVEDRYSCLLRQQNLKINALNNDAVSVDAVVLPTGMEILIIIPVPGGEDPTDSGYVLVDTQTLTWPSGIGLCSDETHTYSIYWRETVVTNCVDGHPVSPNGEPWTNTPNSDGWVLILQTGDGCNEGENGTTKWARPPLQPWPWPNDPLQIGPILLNPAPLQPPSVDCGLWLFLGTAGCATGIAGGNGYRAGIYICVSDATPTKEYTRARGVSDIATYMLEQMGCATQGVRSDFLEINPPGTAPGYVSGINYVTGLPSQVNHLFWIQKSDAIDPAASNPATIGQFTFAEFMTLLSSMRLFWDLDADGYIRIEHWTYWSFPQGIDTADYKTIARNAWKGLASDVPKYERAKWMEARGKDFVGADIIYSGPCARGSEDEQVQEYNFGKYTTDIAMISDFPDSISTEGFAFLAAYFDGTNYHVIVDYGAYSNSIITNAPLSVANLERDYWIYDRLLPSGNMNGVDVDFVGYLPNLEQSPVTVMDMCCDLLLFDPKKRVKTELGDNLGDLLGEVQKAQFEEHDMTTTLTLRYPY